MKIATLVVAVLLLAAGPAAALEKCLTGGSTLFDQRALASLRTSIDAACPCASFTGAKGAARSDYRRCARTVRDAALGISLRRECRAIATRGYADTTCGTTGKVACGKVAPTSKTRPVSCSVKPADKCSDGTKFTATACSGMTHCSDVVDWTAGTCVDVRQRTPFEAGVRTITFTKQSVVNPAQARPLDTVIWYPTNPGAGAINPSYGAVVDAPLAAGAAPYPVVLFSHGSCGFPLQSIFLTALLASQGFVVIAPPHPGNTINEFPNCGTSTAQVNSFLERPQDVIFVLDQMLAENASVGSPFFGALDPDRIAMSGHSFGGLTTYLVEAIEPRVKVAIPMAPAVIGTRSFDVPSLTMIGEIDTVVNNTATRTAYDASEKPKVLVGIEHAGHYAFSGLCFASSDCNPPVTLTQDEAHGQVLRWVLPFLEVYLNGNPDFTPFFLAPLPGVNVDNQLQ